jgi:RNA polymerase sigma-70 factor (ECF subfamily)
MVRTAPPIVEEIPDEALMARVGRGDRAAFEALFLRYREPVWGFFRRRVSDTGAAEELTQDTFLAVLTGASRYEGRAVVRAWLFGIAFNILMAWRRKHREPASFDVEPMAPPADHDSAIWVRAALARLEPEEREILMLRDASSG